MLAWIKEIRNWIFIALGLLLLIAIGSGVYSWYKKPPAVNQAEWTAPSPPPAVKNIKKAPVAGPRTIITIEKQPVADKLKLPDAFKANENLQVIATAEIPAYRGKTNVVSTIDTTTGEGTIIAKQAPLSFFGFVDEKEIGIRYGYRLGSELAQEGSIYGRWDFLRVAGVTVGVYAEGSTRGEGKAQLSVGYKW